MKLTTKMLIGILALSFTMPVLAKDKKAQKAEMEAMMAKAKELGAPNANHKVLEGLAGTWNVTGKMWMKPKDKPTESKGTSVQTVVLGGRFLKQEYKGEFMGQSFEGLGYTGFDNVRQQYESIWMDNFVTGIMRSAGTFDNANNVINQSGTYSCPMTGEKERALRNQWKIVDANSFVYTMYDHDEKGVEFKSMELTYKRAQ